MDFATSLGEELKDQDTHVLVLCPGGLATTREAIDGIAVQDFWGQLTTNPLEIVARETIRRVMKGQGLYIPGRINRCLVCLGKIVPRRYLASFLHHRWQRAQNKRWGVEDAFAPNI